MAKLSAPEKGRINKERYNAYVANLEATSKKFPTNQLGNVNNSLVAEICGFGRNVLYTSLKEQFEEDIKRIGTELHEGVDKATRLDKKASEKTKIASALQKDLDAKVQEIYSLRNQVDELQIKILKLENRENEMDMGMDELISNGRRFSL